MDEPFDDLTRRYAAGSLSRRRAIGLFMAAVAGATLGVRPQRASAGHCGTDRICTTRNGKKACYRPFGGDNNPSQDCKCADGSPGKGEGCVDARPHCGSSDHPCPGGVPPECKCQKL